MKIMLIVFIAFVETLLLEAESFLFFSHRKSFDKEKVLEEFSQEEIDYAILDYYDYGACIFDSFKNVNNDSHKIRELLSNSVLHEYAKNIINDNSAYFARMFYVSRIAGENLEKCDESFWMNFSFQEKMFLLTITPFTIKSYDDLVNKFMESENSLELSVINQVLQRLNKDWHKSSEYNSKVADFCSKTNQYFDYFDSKKTMSQTKHFYLLTKTTFIPIDLNESNDIMSFRLKYAQFSCDDILKYQEECIKNNNILDADSSFRWYEHLDAEEIIPATRDFVADQRFYNNRFFSIRLLINKDFDSSFSMIKNLSDTKKLHKNEKRNFYKCLAKLNQNSNFNIEKKAIINKYLKEQQNSELEIDDKLYLDLLRALYVTEYGLSKERIMYLESLYNNKNYNQQKKCITRRIETIKIAKKIGFYSLFDFYNYYDEHNIEHYRKNVSQPIFIATNNGEIWSYKEINFEAYIAYNTNKYTSSNLVIPNTIDNYPVVGITDEAFVDSQGCITNIIVPNTVRKIGAHAFAHNTNLWSIAIPSSVTDIGQDVFKKSTNLKKIYLEEGSSLTDECFYDSYHVNLHPNCKIIRTKFENGLPVIPPEGVSEAESP